MAAMPPPKRLRISELNPHLLCALCGGYLIDATTIIECLHSFCKTCILRYLETSNYCPICEVLIHKTRPWQNIRSDHALQNAVYKMVPGLFQNEMKRRREFYEHQNLLDKYGRSVGQPQGEVGDRIIFSQDEEFSMSIQFSPDGKPVKDVKTSHLKRPKDSRQHDKRYLKCPAGLRVAHLKKFIRSKFTLPQHIEIDLFYESEPLYDSYSLMDVAYIYLWKRDCVLQLFYSFFEVPTKKRKLQSVTHIPETVSKSSKVIDKPDKNFGDRKSTNKKDKPESKKQSRMSGKKKSTVKAAASSGNSASQPQQGVLVAKGAVSSNLKRKHSDISSTSSWSPRSVSSLETPACSKYVKRCLNNAVPLEKCAQVRAEWHPGSKQTPASSECSVASQLCRDSTNCSIISRHSRESTACSVTSHFCTENAQCSIVSRPCAAHGSRTSKTPADSQVSITLLIKSSDSQDYKHENREPSPHPAAGRLQRGENTSEITYNTFLNGDTLSEIKDNSILTGGKFLEVKNTIHKKCKQESKVTEMNIQNGDMVSEVKVSLNGKMAPELKHKQLVNGQFIFRLKNGNITNGDTLSKANSGKGRYSESSVIDTRCQGDNKDCGLRSIQIGRIVPRDQHTGQKSTLDLTDTKVLLGQGMMLAKNVNVHTRDVKYNNVHTRDGLDVKYNNVHSGETASFVKGKRLNIDRISNMKDNKFHNDDIVFVMKDKKLQSCEKISNVKDPRVENNNKFCDNSFQDTKVTFDFNDKNVLMVDVIPELKDEKLAKGEIHSLEKDQTLVDCKTPPTACLCEQVNSLTSFSPIKLEGIVPSAMSNASNQLGTVPSAMSNASSQLGTVPSATSNASSQLKLEGTLPSAMSNSPSRQQIVDIDDKKLKTGSEERDLKLSYDDQIPKTEDSHSQPQRVVNASGKPSDISAVSQVLQSGNCVDKMQVMCSSGFGGSPAKTDSETVKDLCQDTSKDTATEQKEVQPSKPNTLSQYIQKPPTAMSEKANMLDTRLRVPSAKDVVSDNITHNEACRGSQASCGSNKVNSIVVNALNQDADEAICAKNESLSNQLSSEERSNSSDCRIRISPSLCSMKPNCVDKTHNSLLVTNTIATLQPVANTVATLQPVARTVATLQPVANTIATLQPVTNTVATLHPVTATGTVTLKDSVSTSIDKAVVPYNLLCDSIEQHSAPNTHIQEQHEKQMYSPEALRRLSSSDPQIEKRHDLSESVNLSSNHLPRTTSNVVTVQANHVPVKLPAASSDKPSTNCVVTLATPSPMPAPLKLVESTVASTVSLACSPVTYSVSSTASILPTSFSCLVSASNGGTSTSISTSASSLAKNTTAGKATYGGTKTLASKTCPAQPCTSATIAETRTVDAVSRSAIVAISSSAPHNKCLSPYTVGKDGSHWSRRQSMSAGLSNTPALSQDAPPRVLTSRFTPTSSSSDGALLHVSGSNSIPLTSTSTNTDLTLAACVVSSFLNLPPAETSPMKRPQSRSHLDSTNISAAEMTLPSEATKVDNFLFDIKSPEKESSDSRSQMRSSISCGKETQKSQFRTKLNSVTEHGGIPIDRSLKTIESHITATHHHLPKTVSQTSRPYSMAKSVSTPPSGNTKYGNNIIKTTKISTLIPKSSSVNSKVGAFPKSPSYPTSINSLLLSRSILSNSLASHYPRIDELSVISGTSCLAPGAMPKSSALSSSSTSSTASSLLSSATSTSNHRMSSASRQSSKGTSGRSDKNSKHKTIPPLCIPKSSLIGPTTLKLQRSPGSNDHYIFSPLLHYTPTPQHKVERSKSKESKHKTSHLYKSVHAGAKGNASTASKQRVPTIKISDINRNPVIVENGGSGSSNSNAHYHPPYRSYNHGSSRSSALENGTPRAHSRGRNDVNSSTGRHDKVPVRDILRPSDSELLLSRHWHAYSTAELLFSGFSLPAHTKLHDLQYDTDAMPLDYSQSSSKS